jgi:beta-lactam-binding protein with PASTA domain
VRKTLLAGILVVLAGCSAPPAPQTVAAPVVPEKVIGQTVTPGTKAPSGNLVPDVVGKNHQEAQDALQASGFYNLAEEDATGQGRHLVMDRNWVVVSQDPQGGTVLDPTKKVSLHSKKYTD